MKLEYNSLTDIWILNDHTQIEFRNDKLDKVTNIKVLNECSREVTPIHTYEHLKEIAELSDKEVTVLALKFGAMPEDVTKQLLDLLEATDAKHLLNLSEATDTNLSIILRYLDT